jgi:large subunit ribosomal protein L23
MTAQSDKLNRFGFIVKQTANKLQIKDAVEKMYGVTVTGIRTMNYAGKIKKNA